jgi:hypothetical protein
MPVCCLTPLPAGPGFTGPYAWSSGVLALRSDPYAAFGMASTSPSGRRLLGQAPTAVNGFSSAEKEAAANPTASNQCSVGFFGGSQGQGDSCGAAAAAGHDLLQSTTTTPISSSGGSSIQGQVEAKEIGASSPTRAADGVRGDGRTWVDRSGAVAVAGQVRNG